MSDEQSSTHHGSIGDCVACGEPVTPADENQTADGPVMHGECGW